MYSSYRPQKTDTKIDYNLVNKWYQDVKKLNNTKYDSKDFFVKEDSTGRFISPPWCSRWGSSSRWSSRGS